MKHIYLSISVVVLMLIINTSAYSQFCGTKIVPEQEENLKRLQSRQKFSFSSINQDEITYIPIKIHILRQDNGSGGFTETQLEAAIENLNIQFEFANMQFFVHEEINFINDSYYYDFDSWDEDDLAGPNDVSNVINLYFVNSIQSGTVCGYAYLPGWYDRIFMANECAIDGNVLSHEVGHYFNLYHTHGKSSGFGYTDELVDGSNCETAGDDICDTPADPGLGYHNVDENCSYTDNSTDSNGDLFDPQVRNIMSYSPIHCADLFTEGQYERMAHAMVEYRNYLNTYTEPIVITEPPVVDFFADLLTPITSQFITFKDQSTNRPDAWEWSFSPSEGVVFVEETTENSKNPKVKFSTAGTYSVTLSASNEIGQSSASKDNYIEVLVAEQPVAEFEASTRIAQIDDVITITDASTNTPIEWQWSISPATFTFEDGTNENSQDIKLKFSELGSYTISLQIFNDAGSDEIIKENYIVIEELPGDNCNSAIDLAQVNSPFTASLNDKNNTLDVCYSNEDMIFFMDVPDGHVFEIGQTQNVWYYSQSLRYGDTCPGENEIECYWDSSNRRLKWENSTGQLQRVYYIQGHNYYSETNDFTLTWELREVVAPVADFSTDYRTVEEYYSIQLRDESENEPTAWEWDITPWQNVVFQYSNGKYQKNPYVYFTEEGDYTVKLRVSNSKGEDEVIKENYIKIKGPNSDPGVTTEPEYWLPDEEVTFYFDITGTHLEGTEEAVYFYSENPAYVEENVGTWDNSSENARLTHIEGNSYSFTMIPSVFFGVDEPTGYLWNFSFLLKNKDGSITTYSHWYDYTIAPIADFYHEHEIYAGITTYVYENSSYHPDNFEWTITPSEDVEIIEGDLSSYFMELKFRSAGEYAVRLRVWNGAGEDEIEKTITVLEPPLPVVDFSIYNTEPTIYDEVYFYNYSYNYPETFLWEFTPSTVTYLNGTSETSAYPVVKFNEVGDYSVKLTATNVTGSAELIKENYIQVQQTYCQPQIENPYDAYIYYVEFEPDFINYSWWAGDNGYSDFTDYSPIELSASYNGNLIIYPEGYYSDNGTVSVWVDWNDDMEFSEDEKLVDNASVVFYNETEIPFVLPEGVLPGSYRLRIRLAGSSEGVDNACSDILRGETEDYSLTIIEALPPVASIDLYNPVIDLNDYVWLYAGSGSSFNYPETWEWDFFPSEGVEFIYNTSSTSQNPIVKFSQEGVYSVSLTVTNSEGSDYQVLEDAIRVGVSGSGSCEDALDLASLGGSYMGSTYNTSNDYDGCYMDYANDQFFYIDLPNGASIDIGQTWNNYDSRHELRYGGSCPGDNYIMCIDDWDYERIQWTNNTGESQRVYYIQSGYSYGSGEFEITWDVSGIEVPEANFSMSDEVTYAGESLSFQDLSTGSITSRKWSFYPISGFEFVEGTDRYSESPVVRFDQEGIYEITLNAYNAGGSDSYSLSLEVFSARQLPDVVWEVPSDIVYGTQLSSEQLNASSTVEGEFDYDYEIGTVLNAGDNTLTVTFTPADDVIYQPVTKSVSLKVLKATQTINFPEIGDKKDGDESFELDASSTSGLSLGFSISGQAVYENNLLKITGPGIVTIIAKQDGDQNYLKANDVIQSFCVLPSPEITIDDTSESNSEIKLVSNYESGNQWLLNNEVLEGETKKELIVSKRGTYKLRNKVSGCLGESEPFVVTSFEYSTLTSGINIYPNPAQDKMYLSFSDYTPSTEILFSVYNMAGMKVDEQISRAGDKDLSVEINTSNLNPGTYLLVFNNGKKNYKLKFQKTL